MNRKNISVTALSAVVAIATVAGSIAIAQSAKESKPTTQPEMKLPPGMTEADMQACALAATPGKMHEYLAKGIGTWTGKTTSWMGPDAEPVKSACTSSVKTIMDGRFIQAEVTGDMPGMGPFTGLGLYGFDNVSKKFVSTWVDNFGTGMMTGTGELTSDGKTINWKFTYNCPVTKKPVVMREVETITGPDTKTLEMFGTEPKGTREYRMMSIEFTKQ